MIEPATNWTQHADIHDHVHELTRTHTNREPYIVDASPGHPRYELGHVTTVPALVHQLLLASPAGSGDEAGNGAHSKPAIRVETVDTLIWIDDEAARWVRRLGEDDPGDALEVVRRTPGPHGPTCRSCHHASCAQVRRGEHVVRRVIPGSGTIACIQRVHALHAGLTPCSKPGHRLDDGTWCCPCHHIEHDVSRWWRQARIVSGWDQPAFRPNNTCPVCEQRRTLRVDRVALDAFCVECRSVWAPGEIGILAEHIRAENGEPDAPDDDPDDDADTPDPAPAA